MLFVPFAVIIGKGIGAEAPPTRLKIPAVLSADFL
jgi:hypothetical protein